MELNFIDILHGKLCICSQGRILTRKIHIEPSLRDLSILNIVYILYRLSFFSYLLLLLVCDGDDDETI